MNEIYSLTGTPSPELTDHARMHGWERCIDIALI